MENELWIELPVMAELAYNADEFNVSLSEAIYQEANRIEILDNNINKSYENDK